MFHASAAALVQEDVTGLITVDALAIGGLVP